MATVKAKAGADSATPKQGYQFSDDGAQVTAWNQVNAIRTASDKCAEQVAAAWQIMHSNAPQMTFGSFIELVTKINGKFRGRWGSSDANEHRRAVRMAVVESHNPDGATVGGIKIDLHKLAELAELPFVDEAIEAIEAIGENLSGGDVVEIGGFVLDDDGLSVSWDDTAVVEHYTVTLTESEIAAKSTLTTLIPTLNALRPYYDRVPTRYIKSQTTEFDKPFNRGIYIHGLEYDATTQTYKVAARLFYEGINGRR